MSNPFDATASMLGYLYQCRLALLESLRRARQEGSFTVAIETLDDVEFEATGSPKELLQLKHHLKTTGNLADASSDIWKSIRIWAEGTRNGRWPDDTCFFLVTTESTAPETIAGNLEAGKERSPDDALNALESIAQTSTNTDNKKAYEAFLALGPDERVGLVDRIVVVAKTLNVFDVEKSIREEIALAVRHEHRGAFVERLEGWWFQRVLSHLKRVDEDVIASEELDAQLELLRNAFGPDGLPIDADLLTVEIDEEQFLGRVFVKQLEMIGVKSRRMVTAMREYYRASGHRSRWLREGILLHGELEAYDHRLTEEWEIRFNVMVEELGEEVAEDEMVKAARRIYKWAEQDATIFIRPLVDDPFVTRGSLHVLADRIAIGWHPKFFERLSSSLTTEDV